MDLPILDQELEEEFHISRYIIFYKFISGSIELFLGLGTIFFSQQIFKLYQHFKASELLEDPHDLVVSLIEKVLPYLLEHRVYIVFFLTLFGLIKISGAIGLVYRKHWGLDLLVGFTIFLLPFTSYSLLANPSLSKFIYLTIDILIALYLVNFNPKHYFVNLKRRMKS